MLEEKHVNGSKQALNNYEHSVYLLKDSITETIKLCCVLWGGKKAVWWGILKLHST